MPRKAVDIKAALKNDAKLDGIRAKLADGELTITIPKQVSSCSCYPGLLLCSCPSFGAQLDSADLPHSPCGRESWSSPAAAADGVLPNLDSFSSLARTLLAVVF